MEACDAQFSPYRAIDPNALQAAVESIAHDEYDKRGPDFAAWLHEIWIPSNPEAMTALACLAGGVPAERVAAAVIADTIYDDFLAYAADASWCRERAIRRMQ